MSTDYVEQTTALIHRLDGPELLPHAIRLLADGQPVPLERLAAAAGRSVHDVEAALADLISAVIKRLGWDASPRPGQRAAGG